jgi:hypothetical protein
MHGYNRCSAHAHSQRLVQGLCNIEEVEANVQATPTVLGGW